MSTEELEMRLSQIRDKKVATEVRRFLLNLFLLFDGTPPPHIQTYIGEIMELVEAHRVPERISVALRPV